MTDDTLPVTARTIRDEMIAFGIMTALLLVVPLTGVYPFFVDAGLCFALLACAFNLLTAMADCCRSAMRCSWNRGVLHRPRLKVWGVRPSLEF